MAGQERREVRLDADRPHARATTAVRNAEGLVKIHVAHVGADVSRTCEPYERVEIGAVEIDLTAVRMMVGPAIMYAADTILGFVAALTLMLSLDARLTMLSLIPLPRRGRGSDRGASFDRPCRRRRTRQREAVALDRLAQQLDQNGLVVIGQIGRHSGIMRRKRTEGESTPMTLGSGMT